MRTDGVDSAARSAWRRWSLGLGISLLAHAALLSWWMWDVAVSRPVPAPPSMAVEIVAAPPAPAPEQRPTPAVEPEQRERQPDKPQPQPQVRISDVPSPDQPAVQPAERSPTKTAPAPQPEAPPQRPSQAAAMVKASEDQSATTRSHDPKIRANWEAMVIAALDKAKRYPPSARFARQQGTVFVSFAVERNGSVRDPKLVRSSGIRELDAEATALLRRVRLPPLPEAPGDQTADRVTLLVPIDFALSP